MRFLRKTSRSSPDNENPSDSPEKSSRSFPEPYQILKSCEILSRCFQINSQQPAAQSPGSSQQPASSHQPPARHQLPASQPASHQVPGSSQPAASSPILNPQSPMLNPQSPILNPQSPMVPAGTSHQPGIQPARFQPDASQMPARCQPNTSQVPARYHLQPASHKENW